MSINPTQLAVHIAELIREHILDYRTERDKMLNKLGGDMATELEKFQQLIPKEARTDHLLGMLDKLIIKAEKDEWPDTKLHRWLGYVQGCLLCRGIADLDTLKGFVSKAKLHFDEKEDLELKDHNNPDSPFHLDIGGEG